jgi:hypothetical protein
MENGDGRRFGLIAQQARRFGRGGNMAKSEAGWREKIEINAWSYPN